MDGIDTETPEWDAARCVQARMNAALAEDDGDDVVSVQRMLNQIGAALRPCRYAVRVAKAADAGLPPHRAIIDNDDEARMLEHIAATVDRANRLGTIGPYEQPGRRWPDTRPRVHAYLTIPARQLHSPDHTMRPGPIGNIIDAVAAAGLPGMTPVQEKWLHITLAYTMDADADAERIAAEIVQRAARVRAYPIRLGPVIAGDSHIRMAVADTTAASTVHALSAACRDAFAAAGAEPIGGGDPLPHMTLAYAHGPGPDRADVNRWFAGLEDSYSVVNLHPDSVQVVAVRQDLDVRDGCMFTWDRIAEVTLAETPQPRTTAINNAKETA